MPLPAGVETVTVRSGVPLALPDGTWFKGRLLFTAPDLVTVGEDDLTTGGTVPVDLVDGAFTVNLLATDATGMSPTGWAYKVTSEFSNAKNWVRYITLPKAAPSVKLADVLVPDPVAGTFTVLLDPTALGNAATRNVGTTAGTVAAGNDSRFGAGGSGGRITSVDAPINQGIIVLAAAVAWTIVATPGGAEVAASIPASVGDRIWFSPSFLRTGGVVFLDIGIKAAAGGISRYTSSGGAIPRAEGYAPLYPLANYVGVAGMREFKVQAGELDGNGMATIALAYKGPADGVTQKIYAGAGYDAAFLLINPDRPPA